MCRYVMVKRRSDKFVRRLSRNRCLSVSGSVALVLMASQACERRDSTASLTRQVSIRFATGVPTTNFSRVGADVTDALQKGLPELAVEVLPTQAAFPILKHSSVAMPT